MAKGKKKGGSKSTGLEAGVSSLSVADSGPSTSASTSAPVEEEEECGLTGGRKKKPQKKQATPTPVEEKKDDKPPETVSEAATKPDATKEEEEEVGGLGLTGGAKKSRPRKKKPAQGAQPGQPGPPLGYPGATPGQPGPPLVYPGATPGQPGPPLGYPGATPGQPGPPLGYPGATPGQPGPPLGYPGATSGQPGPPLGYPGATPGQPGPPLGYPGATPGQPGPPHGYPGATPGQPGPPLGYPGATPGQPGPPRGYPGATPGQTGPPLGYPGATPGQPGPPLGYPGATPGQPGPPRGYPGATPGQTGPPLGYPGATPGQPGPPLGYPGATPGQPGPPRGYPGATPGQPGPHGQQYPQAAQPKAPASQATGAIPRQPQATQSAPAMTSVSGPPVKYAPLPKSRQEQTCQHAIPAKILGRSVQCRTVRVQTNYLPMVIKPTKVHRYDFTFVPDKPKRMIPDIYKILKNRCFPNEMVAFDSFKNAYSLNPLNKNIVSDSTNEKQNAVEYVDANGRPMKFNIIIKYTGCVDFTTLLRHMETQGSSLSVPSDVIQCVDVILRQGSLESYVKCGRNFFKRPERPIDLSGGLEIWTGLFQSAIFTSRPYINVDVAHKGFPIHQPMLDAMKSMGLDLTRPIDRQYRGADIFKDFVKGLRVICKQVGGPGQGQNREYVCNVAKDPPTSLSFTRESDGGRPITVYDYFMKEYKYKIKYPNLPCLWVGPRDKTMYYPVELCTVAYGQALRKQLNEFQLSTMVREAATPPDERKRKIEEVARSMNYGQNVLFKKFGLEISNQFLEIEAKVLNPPTLNCGEGRPTLPSRGQWNSQKLFKPEPLVSWGFIGVELAPNACNFEGISSLLLQTGSQMGMEVAKPKMCQFNVTMTDLRALLFRALEQEIRFLFIIVPTRSKDCYHKVKQFAESDVGILTQCIREQTATRRMNHQTIKNILLKVNAKLMGLNQCLANQSLPRCIANGGVMIVGADVTHPSPDQQNIPSIAAVTASMDPKCFVYNIELSIQSPKVEVIGQFEEMMYDHLKMFVQKNQRPPKKIYVFRDGVSEGQFKAVINQELRGLLNAYSRFSKEKPEVLFLLVQKRHHTRLFGTDQRTRKIVNVEPGTVVDTHIVHPKELDFYLVSHAAIKGTARPTRYHSVCNDGGIPQDEVEQLTYYLCHLYSRCMRAVSYPTPTYYAHLACLRARSLTHGTVFNNNELDTKGPKRLRVLDRMLRHSIMFFV